MRGHLSVLLGAAGLAAATPALLQPRHNNSPVLPIPSCCPQLTGPQRNELHISVKPSVHSTGHLVASAEFLGSGLEGCVYGLEQWKDQKDVAAKVHLVPAVQSRFGLEPTNIDRELEALQKIGELIDNFVDLKGKSWVIMKRHHGYHLHQTKAWKRNVGDSEYLDSEGTDDISNCVLFTGKIQELLLSRGRRYWAEHRLVYGDIYLSNFIFNDDATEVEFVDWTHWSRSDKWDEKEVCVP